MPYKDKEKEAINKKVYYKLNKEKIVAYREANKEKRKAYFKTYRKNNKKKLAKQSKIYCSIEKNKKRKQLYNKIYSDNNRKKINIYYKTKRKIDFKYKLNKCMATIIWQALKENKNNKLWRDLVPYTIDDLIKHLEKLFIEGMSWKNYGKDGWVIDHKIPKSIFNYTKPEHEDFKHCWALSNLQPMWAKDNLQKGAKITKHFQPSLLL